MRRFKKQNIALSDSHGILTWPREPVRPMTFITIALWKEKDEAATKISQSPSDVDVRGTCHKLGKGKGCCADLGIQFDRILTRWVGAGSKV